MHHYEDKNGGMTSLGKLYSIGSDGRWAAANI